MEMLRLGLYQMNAWVGDLERNTETILRAIAEARNRGVDIVAFPELAITGYPPEDLLLKPRFLEQNQRALERVAAGTRGITAVVGFVAVDDDIHNAAAVIHDGQVVGVHHKRFLPNYGVFDEDRYFQAGRDYLVFSREGVTFGVGICEDIWYPEGPAYVQALLGGAQVILNINASPYSRGKWAFRDRMLATRASDNACIVAYVNLVGGQDELVFDGHSMVFGPRGEVLHRGPMFREELIVVDLEIGRVQRARLSDPRRRKQKLAMVAEGVPLQRISLEPCQPAAGRPAAVSECAPPPDGLAEVYQALVTGTRDYVEKNGFKEVVVGLSGGIDSALVACIAADALGPERVVGVTMPSVFSSPETRGDAQVLAERLGLRFLTIPIQETVEAFQRQLAGVFAGCRPDTTEENLQARIRGTTLMALSNKFGWLVLTTGNKSEMAVGYATLYGDMAGAFAVLKDVPKTLVYQLSEYRNRLNPVIPESTILRPPTAELRPGQKDTDSLPPYEVLDPILELYVEEDRSFEEIVALGHDAALVRRVLQMVDRSEYKRRQAPPGVKITPKAFGRDRRLPITNRYREG
ncbi:MAG: NAD+ synthase [Armatimonadetes bacterium]|jgi:NAD+ synthase (glutamine-hydrolysing)|nr:NAD+ synthase [Armatimonadota bacterium]